MTVNLRIYLMFVFSIFLIVSCDDDDNPIDSSKREGVVGEVYVTDDAYKFIGYGYDLLDNYADPSQMKGLIFKSWALPAEYTVKRSLESGVFKTVSGSSIKEYQSALQVDFSVSGNYKLFSGAVKTNFKSDYYSLNNTSFSTVKYIINKYQISIPSNYARAELLRPYMTEQAVKDLEDASLSPFRIFDMYGTHVLTGAVMGARLDFNVMMMSQHIKTGQSIRVLAEAEYSSLFSKVNTSSKFKSDEEKNYYTEHREKTLETIGGNTEYGANIINNQDYNKWISSIGNKSVLCDYTPGGLIPIWEFCDDSTRKNEIRAAFDNWATQRQIITHDGPAPPRNCILDIAIYRSDRGDYVDQNGMRYYKMNSDLNAKAGGDYIFIYYAYGLDNTPGSFSPITALYLKHAHKHGDATGGESGYSRIDVDLNAGAGGDYIYLYISREKSKGDPIRGLQIYNQNRGSHVFSQPEILTGYWDVRSNNSNPLDLNKGAGGDYIYLKYSRD